MYSVCVGPKLPLVVTGGGQNINFQLELDEALTPRFGKQLITTEFWT